MVCDENNWIWSPETLRNVFFAFAAAQNKSPPEGPKRGPSSGLLFCLLRSIEQCVFVGIGVRLCVNKGNGQKPLPRGHGQRGRWQWGHGRRPWPRVIHFRAPGHSHDNKDKRFFPRPRREVRAQANGKGLCFEIECEGDVVQDHVQEALTCGSMY